MENLEWNLYDKSNWVNGEWKTEPDKIQWSDNATGYPCLIRRVEKTGILCGYVGVNSKHPLFGIYDKTFDASVEVHGGITFATKSSSDIDYVIEEKYDNSIWWVGFDCHHSSDLTPIDLAQKMGLNCPPEFKEVELRIKKVLKQNYRNVTYVKEQCKLLAMQLKKLEYESTNH